MVSTTSSTRAVKDSAKSVSSKSSAKSSSLSSSVSSSTKSKNDASSASSKTNGVSSSKTADKRKSKSKAKSDSYTDTSANTSSTLESLESSESLEYPVSSEHNYTMYQYAHGLDDPISEYRYNTNDESIQSHTDAMGTYLQKFDQFMAQSSQTGGS